METTSTNTGHSTHHQVKLLLDVHKARWKGEEATWNRHRLHGGVGRVRLQVTPRPIRNLYPPLIHAQTAHTHYPYITVPVCRLRVDHKYNIAVIYYYIIVYHIILCNIGICFIQNSPPRTPSKKQNCYACELPLAGEAGLTAAVVSLLFEIPKFTYGNTILVSDALSFTPSSQNHADTVSEIRFFDNDITRWVYIFEQRRGDNYGD